MRWALAISCVLLVGNISLAETVIFQDNFDGNTPFNPPSGWVASASGGNGQGRALTQSGNLFNPGQYGSHDVWAAEAFINVPGAGAERSGSVTLDHSLGISALAGTSYAISVDVGLLESSMNTEASNGNYGIQLWAGTPNIGGSSLLWEISVNNGHQDASAPAVGDWMNWSGSYTATAGTPSSPLYLRLFSNDNGGGALQDYIAWDDVSVSASAAPLPSAACGGIALLSAVGLFSKSLHRKASAPS
jgi:hypothetical protein